MNKFKNMCENGIDYVKSSVEIAFCNRLVQSSGTTFQSDATELNVTQWLRKCGLCDPIQYFSGLQTFFDSKHMKKRF